MKTLLQTIPLDNFEELQSYFDGTPHNWTGLKVNLKEANIYISCDVVASDMKGKFFISKKIEIEIYNERGEVMRKTRLLANFVEHYSTGFFAGWRKDPSIALPILNKIETFNGKWI